MDMASPASPHCSTPAESDGMPDDSSAASTLTATTLPRAGSSVADDADESDLIVQGPHYPGSGLRAEVPLPEPMFQRSSSPSIDHVDPHAMARPPLMVRVARRKPAHAHHASFSTGSPEACMIHSQSEPSSPALQMTGRSMRRQSSRQMGPEVSGCALTTSLSLVASAASAAACAASACGVSGKLQRVLQRSVQRYVQPAAGLSPGGNSASSGGANPSCGQHTVDLGSPTRTNSVLQLTRLPSIHHPGHAKPPLAPSLASSPAQSHRLAAGHSSANHSHDAFADSCGSGGLAEEACAERNSAGDSGTRPVSRFARLTASGSHPPFAFAQPPSPHPPAVPASASSPISLARGGGSGSSHGDPQSFMWPCSPPRPSGSPSGPSSRASMGQLTLQSGSGNLNRRSSSLATQALASGLSFSTSPTSPFALAHASRPDRSFNHSHHAAPCQGAALEDVHAPPAHVAHAKGGARRESQDPARGVLSSAPLGSMADLLAPSMKSEPVGRINRLQRLLARVTAI